MSSPPINTTLNNALYSQNTGTTQSNPFITFYSLRDPTQFDINYPIQKRWVNFLLVREWILKSFTNTTGVTTANWVLLNSAANAIISITVPAGGTATDIVADAIGEVYFTSSNNSIVIKGSNAPTDNHFIDFTLAGGGQAVESIFGDDGIGNDVVPNPSTHEIEFVGLTITAAAGAINGKPVFFKKNAANSERLEVQVSSQQPTADILKAGLSSFDDMFFVVDPATGFVTSTAIANTLGPANIGIKLDTGVFTIVGANGQFLSASNPGYVTLHSNTIIGGFITYKLTFASLAASPNFHDNSSGTSTIAGNTFGLDNNVNCANTVPFFLYAVSKSDDTDVKFMISRYPNSMISPVAGKIAQTGLTTQGSFFTFDGTIVAADYASTNCTCLGAFRMTKVATNANDWTVTALAASEGIGNFFEGGQFAWPLGFFGADPNSLFRPNGGTAPIYNDNAIAYSVGRDNVVEVGYVLGNNTTPGAGAFQAQIVYPFIALSGGSVQSGNLDAAAMLISTGIANQSYFVMNFQSAAANGSLELATIGANSIILNGKAKILFS